MSKRTDNFWWKLHSWTGLYVGIVIGVVCLTGGVAVFIPEIDRLLNPGLYRVAVQPPQPAQLNSTLDQTLRQYPNHRILSLELPDQPGEAILLDLISMGKKAEEGDRRAVFLNPYTGQTIGSRNEANTLANYLRQIHVRLYDGLYGRQLVGLSGIALFLSALSGLVIYGRFTKKRSYADIRRGRGLRIWMADWHKLLGMSALVFNLMIAGTGAWLGLQTKLMKWFSMPFPNAYAVTEKPLTPAADHRTPLDLPRTLAAARQHFPDLQPRIVRPSYQGEGLIEVLGDVPTGVYERSINKVVLYKADYALRFRYDVRQQNGWHKLYFVQEGLHFGQFGGLTLKWLYFALGMLASFLSVSGFIVSLQRHAPKGIPRAEAERPVLKRVFVWCMALLAVLFLIAFSSLTAGYVVTATVVTAGVYIGLGGGLLWLVGRRVVRWRQRTRQGNAQPEPEERYG
jgi:uncharacterized iron-regulated membrane protein